MKTTKRIILLMICILILSPKGSSAALLNEGFSLKELNLPVNSNREKDEAIFATDYRSAILSIVNSAPIKIGETVRFDLKVNPQSQPINTVMAELGYSTTTLKLVAIDDELSSFSIFDLGAEEEGSVRIDCLQPWPGIKSESVVISLYFNVLKEGEVRIDFEDYSKVLASDGFGTDVLSEVVGYSEVLR